MQADKRLKELLSGKAKWILILGLAGMLLILLSCFWPSGDKQEDAGMPAVSTDEYTRQLEQQMQQLVCKIDGVGQAEVMVTLENGVENVYANSQKKSNDTTGGTGQSANRTDTEQEVVIVDGESGRQALVVTQREPTVKGVVIVCEGADNMAVVERVTDAVRAALNVKANRISVVKAAPSQAAE